MVATSDADFEAKGQEHIVTIAVPHGFAASDSVVSWLMPVNTWRTCESAGSAIFVVIAVHHDFGSRILPGFIAVGLVIAAGAYALLPAALYTLRSGLHRTPAWTRPAIASFRQGIVYCFGWGGELDRILAPVHRELREPVIVARLYTPLPEVLWVIVHVTVACAVLVAARGAAPLLWILGFPVLLLSTPITRVVAWAIHSLRPVYYRITPGLIELLRVRLFTGELYLKRRVSLQKCALVIRYDKRFVRVIHDPNTGTGESIALEGLGAPHVFAEGMAWALRSPPPTQRVPLPEDSLLG